MNDRPDLEARLARFLVDDAPPRAPERLVEAARERVAETRQSRRAGLFGGRLWSVMLTPVGAVAAVILVVVVGAALASFNGFGPSIGSASPSPTPSASPSPSPSPTPSPTPYPCESGPGTCFGTLAPGTYDSRSFLPAVQYSVADGWANSADNVGQLDLRYAAGGEYEYPDGITFHDGISVFRQPIAESMTTREPLDGVGTTANDLAQWLVGHDNLQASTPTPVSIGGATGYRLSLSVPTGARTTPDQCTDHGVPRCVSLFLSADPDATYGFGVVGPETVVVYLLDTPSGDTVMVVIDDVDGVNQPGSRRPPRPSSTASSSPPDQASNERRSRVCFTLPAGLDHRGRPRGRCRLREHDHRAIAQSDHGRPVDAAS